MTKHHTSFQPLDVKRYVPVCSCGFRGAVVASAVAALALANAHARAQGAEPWPPQANPSLTRRQREALEWITRVGKASPKLIRRHGFQQRTLDALADAGLIEREYISRVVGGPFPVYRVVRDAG